MPAYHVTDISQANTVHDLHLPGINLLYTCFIIFIWINSEYTSGIYLAYLENCSMYMLGISKVSETWQDTSIHWIRQASADQSINTCYCQSTGACADKNSCFMWLCQLSVQFLLCGWCQVPKHCKTLNWWHIPHTHSWECGQWAATVYFRE